MNQPGHIHQTSPQEPLNASCSRKTRRVFRPVQFADPVITSQKEAELNVVDAMMQMHSQLGSREEELVELIHRPSLAAEWLSIAQAAARSSLSEKTIRRAIRAKGRNRLNAFDVGLPGRHTWRISAVDLDTWIRRNGDVTGAPSPVPTFNAKNRSNYFEGF